jgi:hypothetical protein
MASKKLDNKMAKHELLRDKIVNYVLKYFFWGYEGITVDKISIEIAKMKLQNHFDTNEEVEDFIMYDDIEATPIAVTAGSYKELDRMIEEYRQEEIEIQKINKIEEMESNPLNIYNLPENPIIDQLTQRIIQGLKRPGKKKHIRKRPVLLKLPNGRYRCDSLEVFVIGYCKLLKEFSDAPPLEPDIIRDYLVSKQYLMPYSDDAIELAINKYKFEEK